MYNNKNRKNTFNKFNFTTLVKFWRRNKYLTVQYNKTVSLLNKTFSAFYFYCSSSSNFSSFCREDRLSTPSLTFGRPPTPPGAIWRIMNDATPSPPTRQRIPPPHRPIPPTDAATAAPLAASRSNSRAPAAAAAIATWPMCSRYFLL